VGIFYFSGTGNTELVAGMLRDELVRRECAVELVRIEDVLKKGALPDLNRYDLIGIGSPVIGFASPAVVGRFVRMFPKAKGMRTFVFRTAGGVAPINYNASKPVMRSLARRGYDVFYERVFSISSNWISKFDDEVIVRLHEATRRKAGLMSDALLRDERRILKTGLVMKMLMECVMHATPFFFRLVGKDYAVSDACTHCGLCVKNCPACNIFEKNGRIRFKLSCNCCMRCVYSCPKNAIHFRKFSSFAVKGGYNIKKILAQPSSKVEPEKKPAPRFFERYLSDDAL
jgi:ferredoxin